MRGSCDSTKMPLDTSAYNLAHLRLDGRRWNELRRLHAQISTQTAADGSSFLEMGHTKVICTVNGPQEQKRGGATRDQSNEAKIEVEIGFAGFSGTDRRKRARGDKYGVGYLVMASADNHAGGHQRCRTQFPAPLPQHFLPTSTLTALSISTFTFSRRTAPCSPHA